MTNGTLSNVRIDRAARTRTDDTGTVEPSPLELDKLHKRLERITQRSSDIGNAISEYTELLVELTSADGAAYTRIQTGRDPQLLSARFEQSGLPEELLRREISDAALAASKTQQLVLQRVGPRRSRLVLALPVNLQPNIQDALVVVLALAGQPVEPFVVSLNLVAAHLQLWLRAAEASTQQWEAGNAAALVELISTVSSAQDLPAALQAFANECKRLFNAKHSAVAVKKRFGAGVRLKTMGGVSSIDHRSDRAAHIEAAMNEAMTQKKIIVVPAPTDDVRQADIAAKRLVDHWKVDSVAVMPLMDANNAVHSVLLLAGDREKIASVRATYLLKASQSALSTCMQGAVKADGTILRRLARSIGALAEGWKPVVAIAAVALTGMALLMPMTHKISGNGTVAAVGRRFVVAPYDGVLKQTFAKPGDVVRSGQVLGSMDDRELVWQIAGLVADRNRASKQRDTYRAEHEIAKAQMSELEMKQLGLKLDVLRHRQANLDVKSQVDGVVLTGDLEGAEGAPVKIGEPLYEIAPLDAVRFEVAILEEDLAFVQEGMSVNIRMDGDLARVVPGTLSRIRPKAEIRGGANVFVGEVDLDNSQGQLRPGMQGRVEIVEGQRSIGWVMFHRAWDHTLAGLGL